MKPLEDLITAAKASPKRIALVEGKDRRVIKAAIHVQADQLAGIVLVGDLGRIRSRLIEQSADPDCFEIADPTASSLAGPFAHRYRALRKHKGIDLAGARNAVCNPLDFAAIMVREDHADGTIGGAVAATADRGRAALQIIGRARGTRKFGNHGGDLCFKLFPHPDPSGECADHGAGALLGQRFRPNWRCHDGTVSSRIDDDEPCVLSGPRGLPVGGYG